MIRADGGGDAPEDIMGGFKVAFYSLSWRADACKVKGLNIQAIHDSMDF